MSPKIDVKGSNLIIGISISISSYLSIFNTFSLTLIILDPFGPGPQRSRFISRSREDFLNNVLTKIANNIYGDIEDNPWLSALVPRRLCIHEHFEITSASKWAYLSLHSRRIPSWCLRCREIMCMHVLPSIWPKPGKMPFSRKDCVWCGWLLSILDWHRYTCRWSPYSQTKSFIICSLVCNVVWFSYYVHQIMHELCMYSWMSMNSYVSICVMCARVYVHLCRFMSVLFGAYMCASLGNSM